MISAEGIDTIDESDTLAAVSICLETIGCIQFNKAFSDLATGPLLADQCMVFSYGTQTPRCLLSHNNRPKGEARALAANYIVHGYKNDPIQRYIKSMSTFDGIEIERTHHRCYRL